MKRKLARQVNAPKESEKILNTRSMTTRQMTHFVNEDAQQGTDGPARRVLRKRGNILQNQNKSSILISESDKENAFIKTPSKLRNRKGKKVLGIGNLNDKVAKGSEIVRKDESDIYDITLYIGSDELPNNTNDKKKRRQQKSRLSRSLNKSSVNKKRPAKILMSVSLDEKKSSPSNEIRNDASSAPSENSQALWNLSQTSEEQSTKEESQMEVEANNKENADQDSVVNLNITDLQRRMSAMMTTDYLTSTPDKRESTIASDSSSCCSRRNSSVRDLAFAMSPIKDVPNDACYSLFADIEYPELYNIDVQERVKRPKRDYSNIKGLSILKPSTNTKQAKKTNIRRKKPLDKKYEAWASTMNEHFQEVDSFELVVE